MMPVNYTVDHLHTNLLDGPFMWCFAAFFVWNSFFQTKAIITGAI